MLQIHLSNELAKSLHTQVKSVQDVDPKALQFYGHQVEVCGRTCVVLMELQSRYALIFLDLKADDFDCFYDVLQERLWREVCEIASMDEGISEDDYALLSDLVLNFSVEQYYQLGSDRSVSSHISQVTSYLRDVFEVAGYPIPQGHAGAIDIGLEVNDELRSRKGDKGYFVPYEVFRNFWVGLTKTLRNSLSQDSPSPDVEAEKSGQVIHVDFGARKKSNE